MFMSFSWCSSSSASNDAKLLITSTLASRDMGRLPGFLKRRFFFVCVCFFSTPKTSRITRTNRKRTDLWPAVTQINPSTRYTTRTQQCGYTEAGKHNYISVETHVECVRLWTKRRRQRWPNVSIIESTHWVKAADSIQLCFMCTWIEEEANINVDMADNWSSVWSRK